MGIRLNGFTNTIVRNNVVYNNDPQIVIQDKNGVSQDNVVEGNIIFSLTPEQLGLSLTNDTEHGSYNNNFYCNPHNAVVIKRDDKRYSLAHWQNQFPPHDKNSKSCDLRFEQYSVSDVGSNLITNSTFETDVSGWNDSGASTISHDADSGSLKAVYSGTGNANVLSNVFDLVENQNYRLKFSVIGNGFGNIQLRTNDTTPGASWQIIKETFFAYDTEKRQNYEVFFKSSVSSTYGKHLFITKDYDADTYWLDNVTFEPVGDFAPATKKSVLFTNTTDAQKTINLGNKVYFDLESHIVASSITLEPFTSKILIFLGQRSPPAQAILIAPIGTINENTPTYIWNTVNTATWYHLWINGPTGKILAKWYKAEEIDCDTDKCQITPAVTLTKGAHTWWIQTWNGAGHGPWSEGMTFTTNTGIERPPVATLISPKDIISEATPTYTWHAVNTATWYYFWINDTAGKKLAKWYKAEEIGCGAGTCQITPQITLATGKYTWWIQTWNKAGRGPWSEGMKFTTGIELPPKATLISPKDIISEATPTYTWHAVNTATWYYFWINDTAGKKLAKWYKAEEIGCGAGTCQITPQITLATGKYTWWIQTWNIAGSGAWSEGMEFTHE